MSYIKPTFILLLALAGLSCTVKHVPQMPVIKSEQGLEAARQCQHTYSIASSECAKVYRDGQRNNCIRRANTILEQCYMTIEQ